MARPVLLPPKTQVLLVKSAVHVGMGWFLACPISAQFVLCCWTLYRCTYRDCGYRVPGLDPTLKRSHRGL